MNFLAAAVALVTANMGKAETMESELESAGGRDASQFREMDVGLADVALSANRETSASQEPTEKSFQRRWFLTLMQNEGARPRPRHESPVQAHPCFFNRFRAGVVSCVGAQAQSPGDWLGGLCPVECRTLTVSLATAFTPQSSSLPFACAATCWKLHLPDHHRLGKSHMLSLNNSSPNASTSMRCGPRVAKNTLGTVELPCPSSIDCWCDKSQCAASIHLSFCSIEGSELSRLLRCIVACDPDWMDLVRSATVLSPILICAPQIVVCVPQSVSVDSQFFAL